MEELALDWVVTDDEELGCVAIDKDEAAMDAVVVVGLAVEPVGDGAVTVNVTVAGGEVTVTVAGVL